MVDKQTKRERERTNIDVGVMRRGKSDKDWEEVKVKLSCHVRGGRVFV